MARAQLTLNELTRNGTNLATEAGDVSNGNFFIPAADRSILCSFFSTTGGAVTIRGSAYCDGDNRTGIKVSDRVLTLSVATVYLWFLPNTNVSNPYLNSDGTIHIDYSGACSVALYSV